MPTITGFQTDSCQPEVHRMALQHLCTGSTYMLNGLKFKLTLLLRIYFCLQLQVGCSTVLKMPSAEAADLQRANRTGHGDETSLHVVKRIRVCSPSLAAMADNRTKH